VRRRRAFLLVTVLLISLILFTMGLAFLGSRIGLYQSTSQAALACQARALARSGLEGARIKLQKDVSFPPAGGIQQLTYEYSEDMTDGPAGAYLGWYRVVVDSTFAISPYQVLCVTSIGFAGPRTASVSHHAYSSYIDVNPASATYFQVVRFEDLGTL
jgi:hypothetical protein